MKGFIQFGTVHARNSFFLFVLKTFMFIFPAILISHILDEEMNKIYNKTQSDPLHCIMLMVHIITIIGIMYFFIFFFERYSYEFQTTIAGSFFIAMFFGFQPYFMEHLKYYIRKLY
jgi:hypothetical protein